MMYDELTLTLIVKLPKYMVRDITTRDHLLIKKKQVFLFLSHFILLQLNTYPLET